MGGECLLSRVHLPRKTPPHYHCHLSHNKLNGNGDAKDKDDGDVFADIEDDADAPWLCSQLYSLRKLSTKKYLRNGSASPTKFSSRRHSNDRDSQRSCFMTASLNKLSGKTTVTKTVPTPSPIKSEAITTLDGNQWLWVYFVNGDGSNKSLFFRCGFFVKYLPFQGFPVVISAKCSLFNAFYVCWLSNWF